MSRSFLVFLLSLTVAGLLWGAHGDSPDGATVDNNESSAKAVVADGGSSRRQVAPGVIRVPYFVVRAASRVPLALLRIFTWLPRHVVMNMAQLMSRLMRAFKDYAMDMLGYLASSNRTDLVRVRRGVPVKVAASGSKPTRRGINMNSLIIGLFAYPMKVIYKTAFGLLRFLPYAGVLTLSSSLLNTPVVLMADNVTRDMADYAAAKAWNFTKRNVLPRLDSFVNDLKDSGNVPQSLMAMLLELQTLYHIFKFLGMA